jgi:hypothetical protein
MHPYYSTYQRYGTALSIESRKAEKHFRNTCKDKKNVLVSLSTGYAGDHVPNTPYGNILKNGFYPEFLEQLFQKTKTSIRWLIRCHPLHLRNEILYERLFQKLKELTIRYSNVEWEMPSKAPFSAIMQVASGQITMASMASYDAAYFGIPTLLMCPFANPNQTKPFLFDDLYERGYAKHISVSDLKALEKTEKWINELSKAKDENNVRMPDYPTIVDSIYKITERLEKK